MKTPLRPKFNGQRIAAARRALGMSQANLAHAVGISRFQLIRIERGLSGSIDSLNTICRHIGIPVAEVFELQAA